MLKVILFTLVGCVVIAAAWLLAGVTGHVAVSIGTFSFETSAPFAILMLVVFVVVILILVRILRALLSAPSNSARWRRRRRLSLGNRAISRVLTALAAGEEGTARKEARRARDLLGDSPQTLLLVAEAGRLSGREDEAEQAFRALAKQKDGRFLGLRGLLRQAVDRRDWQQAMAIAKEAEAAHPGAIWLRQQRAELALQTENWAEALQLIGTDARRSTYYIAAADAEADPKRALGFAKQACNQDPAFSPAVLAYASRLRERGYEKRAQRCVMDAWQRSPHPDLAAFALAPESGKLARARAAQRLTARNPEHPESRILLAQVALDAGLIAEARQQVESAEADGITSAVYVCCSRISRNRNVATPRREDWPAGCAAPGRDRGARSALAMHPLSYRPGDMASEMSVMRQYRNDSMADRRTHLWIARHSRMTPSIGNGV